MNRSGAVMGGGHVIRKYVSCGMCTQLHGVIPNRVEFCLTLRAARSSSETTVGLHRVLHVHKL